MMDEFKPDWDGLPPEERALAEDAAQRLQPSLEEEIRDALAARLLGFVGLPKRRTTNQHMVAAIRSVLAQLQNEGAIEHFEVAPSTEHKSAGCVAVRIRRSDLRVYSLEVTIDP